MLRRVHRMLMGLIHASRPGSRPVSGPIKMTTDQITSIKLSYENAGWARCLNADLHFKWVKQGGKNDEEDEAPEVGVAGNTGIPLLLLFRRVLTLTRCESQIPCQRWTSDLCAVDQGCAMCSYASYRCSL